MSILVDYRCPSCGSQEERWVPSPPPTAATCSECGQASRRQFAAVGLSVGASADGARTTETTSPDPKKEASLCQHFPQIPGLCHMTPSAQRRWVATYQRDNRMLEHEIATQEAIAKERPPIMADAISHQHTY